MREEELVKWLLGASQEKQGCSSQVKGQGIFLFFGVTCADARTNKQWRGEKGLEGTVVFFPHRGARTVKLEKNATGSLTGVMLQRTDPSPVCTEQTGAR